MKREQFDVTLRNTGSGGQNKGFSLYNQGNAG
jgi:hypothetical protein